MTRIIKLIIISAVIFYLLPHSDAKPYEELWGKNSEQLKKLVSKDKRIYSFDPAKQLRYRNRIYSLFTSMGVNSEYINILRLEGNPLIDFMFYKNKLYSATEDWRNTKKSNIEKLKIMLKKRYGKADIQFKDDLTIYSYKKNRTVVILYTKEIDNSSSRCKVYYYSKKIFNTLFAE